MRCNKDSRLGFDSENHGDAGHKFERDIRRGADPPRLRGHLPQSRTRGNNSPLINGYPLISVLLH